MMNNKISNKVMNIGDAYDKIEMLKAQIAAAEEEMRKLEKEIENRIPKISPEPARGGYAGKIAARYAGGKRKLVRGKTYEECLEKIKEVLKENLNKEIEKEMTVGELVADYLKYKESSIKKTTLTLYNSRYNARIKDTEFAKKKLSEVNMITCQEYLGELYDAETSFDLVKGAIVVLAGAFDYAMAKDLMDKNYIKLVKVNKNKCRIVEKKATKAWSEKEIKEIGEHSLNDWKEKRKYRHSAAFMVLTYTGLRIGELLALDWSDIDFENKTLSINKTLAHHREDIDGEYKVEATTPKTADSVRTIKLNDLAIFWFKEIKKRNVASGLGHVNHVITSKEGNRCLHYSLLNTFKRFCEAHDIVYQSSHAGRKSNATMLLNGNMSPVYVKDVLGHKNTTTTMNIYYQNVENSETSQEKVNNIMMVTAGDSVKNAI